MSLLKQPVSIFLPVKKITKMIYQPWGKLQTAPMCGVDGVFGVIVALSVVAELKDENELW